MKCVSFIWSNFCINWMYNCANLGRIAFPEQWSQSIDNKTLTIMGCLETSLFLSSYNLPNIVWECICRVWYRTCSTIDFRTTLRLWEARVFRYRSLYVFLLKKKKWSKNGWVYRTCVVYKGNLNQQYYQIYLIHRIL